MPRTPKLRTAKEWVATWQTRRGHTEAELRTKLEAKGFSEAAISEALPWAKTYAGQSDEFAASDLVAARKQQKYGAARIVAELVKRGIAGPEKFVAASDNEELARAESALVSSKQKDPLRAAAWLARRGFSEDIARRAVESRLGRLE